MAADESSGRVALPVGTGAGRVSIAPDGSLSQPALEAAEATNSEHPTLHRQPIDKRRSDSDHPPPPSTLKPTQLRLISIFSMMLFGAVLIAGILRSFVPKEDQVIVIERERSPVATEAGSAAVAPAAAEPTDEDSEKLTKVAAGEAAPARASSAVSPAANKQANAAPVEPDPVLLTSRFAHEQPRVQRCFTMQAQEADARADLTLEFQVSSAGQVERAELLSANAASAGLGSCLVEVAKSTRFPRLTHGVTFRIPIQARVAQP
jgi:hypothetical protein